MHTDEGLTGLGETFFFAGRGRGARPRRARRRTCSGKTRRTSSATRTRLRGYVGAAVERSRDARRLGDRHRALGPARQGARPAPARPARRQVTRARSGPTTRAPVSATSVAAARQAVSNWGLYEPSSDGRHEDLEAFLHRPDELARSLLDEGITGMKIWPFDPYAEASLGHDISAAELELALEPFRQIRDAVGAEMDVMVELHGLWDVRPRAGSCAALDEFEPVLDRGPGPRHERRRPRRGPARDATSRSRPARRSRGLADYRDLLARDGARIVIFDVGWVGGITGRARSPRSPRPTNGRWRRTTARGRSSTWPPRTCRCTCPTRSARRACAPSGTAGTGTSLPRCR